MERMLDSLFVIITFIPGLSSLSVLTALAPDIAALCVMVVFMALNGDLVLSLPTEQKPEPADGLTLTLENADANDLKSITLNGKKVDPSNYSVTKTEDGIVITLSPKFLQTLAGGSYMLSAELSGGKAETQITIESSASPIGTYGDLDGDGQITANDALTILRASIGIEELPPEQRVIADVDNDGEITVNDALAVLRYSVGIPDFDNPINKPVAA